MPMDKSHPTQKIQPQPRLLQGGVVRTSGIVARRLVMCCKKAPCHRPQNSPARGGGIDWECAYSCKTYVDVTFNVRHAFFFCSIECSIRGPRTQKTITSFDGFPTPRQPPEGVFSTPARPRVPVASGYSSLIRTTLH